MKNSKILAIVVLALASVASAAPFTYLTINGEALDAITLKTGQVCTVGVVSTTSFEYEANVGFDDRVVLGSFDKPRVTPLAGDQASITEVDKTTFYGYRCIAEGYFVLRPGVHFTIEYEPNQVGETDIKLYSDGLSTLIDSIHVTIVSGDMGTAFTYQGRLMEDGNPADGLHDFQFSLYNDANTLIGNQLGDTLSRYEVDVIDGYFTVELDFNSPSAFNGYARWLEIGVRPGELFDPCEYTILSPRQEVTPVPYALYAGSDNDWMVSGDNMYSIPAGNVGIGTDSPTAKLYVRSSDNTVIQSYATGENNYSGFFSGGRGLCVFGTDEMGGRLSLMGLGAFPITDKWGTIEFKDLYNNVKGSIISRSTIIGHVLWLGAGEDAQMCIYNNNRVGIGTFLPAGQLGLGEYQGGTAGSVVAGHEKQLVLGGEYNTGFNAGSSVKLLISDYDNDGDADIYPIYCEDEQNRVDFYVRKQDGSVSTAYFGGKVGIGTKEPAGRLDIRSSTDTSCMFAVSEGTSVNAWFSVASTSGNHAIMATSNSNLSAAVRISNTGSGGALSVEGTAQVDVLQIMGADVAEKFPVRQKETIKPGMVVAIDPDHPGKLCLSRTAYNRCVAGVVSGANGLPAGAILGNLPSQEETMPVALSGRVWVYCDATEHPIEPGDLLTTAERSGYAMAVTEYQRAHGAVIGKAMTELSEGETGLVLVLVNLQ